MKGREGGFATVWMVGAMGVVWALAAVVLLAGGVRVARHRAHNAADEAALAVAASAGLGQRAACGKGTAIARRNGARLVRCGLVGTAVQGMAGKARVEVELDWRVPGYGRLPVRAGALAGPVGSARGP